MERTDKIPDRLPIVVSKIVLGGSKTQMGPQISVLLGEPWIFFVVPVYPTHRDKVPLPIPIGEPSKLMDFHAQ